MVGKIPSLKMKNTKRCYKKLFKTNIKLSKFHRLPYDIGRFLPHMDSVY